MRFPQPSPPAGQQDRFVIAAGSASGRTVLNRVMYRSFLTVTSRPG